MKSVSTPILIYDGHCPFCRKQVQNLRGLVGERFAVESFQEKGVLERYPELTHAECMKEIKLVVKKGHILGGAHAIFYTLSLSPFYRPLRWLYQTPGFKQILNFFYAVIAKNRYKIQKKDCPDGTCFIQEKSTSPHRTVPGTKA